MPLLFSATDAKNNDPSAVQESPQANPVTVEEYLSPVNQGETGYATIPELAYENTAMVGPQYEEPAAVLKRPVVYEKLHTT